MPLERFAPHAEHRLLRRERVGDERAAEHLRAAGHVRQPFGHQSPGHRLRGGQRPAARTHQVRDHSLHGRGALAEHVVPDAGAYLLAEAGERLVHVSRQAVCGDPHADLRKRGAKREPALVGGDRSLHHFVQRRFARTERLEAPAAIDSPALVEAPDPRQHRVFHHRLHLARHPGHDHDEASLATPVDLDPVSGRGAEWIRQDDGALGKVRLPQIVFGHGAPDGAEQRADVLGGSLVEKHLAAEHRRDRFGGEVVRRRPEASGRDHQVGAIEPAGERPANPLGVVADGDHRHEVDSDLEQLVGEEIRVGVYGEAGSELVARGKDDGLLDHDFPGPILGACPHAGKRVIPG